MNSLSIDWLIHLHLAGPEYVRWPHCVQSWLYSRGWHLQTIVSAQDCLGLDSAVIWYFCADVQFGSEMVKLYTGRIPDDRCIDALRVGLFMCCVVGWTPSEKTIPATLFLVRPVASQYSFFFLSLDFFAVPVSLALALSRNIFFWVVLQKVVCAYQFPLCSSDVKQHSNICRSPQDFCAYLRVKSADVCQHTHS